MEIVRLPVIGDRRQELLTLLQTHSYFAQTDIATYRILTAGENDEVVLLIDWADPGAPERALASSAGVDFLERVRSILSGPPIISYHRSVP